MTDKQKETDGVNEFPEEEQTWGGAGLTSVDPSFFQKTQTNRAWRETGESKTPEHMQNKSQEAGKQASQRKAGQRDQKYWVESWCLYTEAAGEAWLHDWESDL